MDRPIGVLYAVLGETCCLTTDRKESFELQVGDSVLLLDDVRVSIASHRGANLVSFLDVWRALGLPEELGSRSRREAPIHFGSDETSDNPKLLTVAFVLHEPHRNQLLSKLPDLMVLRKSQGSSSPWFSAALEWLTKKGSGHEPGFAAPATSLADLLLTTFLRDYVLTLSKGQFGWLTALTDARIGNALTAINSLPERDWRLKTLAAEAGMSRANFSRKFMALVGQSPGQYLTATRMHHAARELLKGGMSVSDIAERYGYQSESAFRAAFKKHIGHGPRDYLREVASCSVKPFTRWLSVSPDGLEQPGDGRRALRSGHLAVG